MPPVSSLVFVVILAVWAVYLVQHWVRRRDHLATARSVDRFSEAMRVLERRRALPVPQPDAAAPSYAASPLRPARPARPEVVVKRAGAQLSGATAVAPSADHRRTHHAARLRAGGLLAGSLAMLLLVALAVAGVAPRWAALVGVGLCAAAFGLVRLSVARQQAAWRQRSRPAGSRRAPASRVAATGTSEARRRSDPERRAAPVGGTVPEHRTAPERRTAAVRHRAGTQQGHGVHHGAVRQTATLREQPSSRTVSAAAASGQRPLDGHQFSAQSVAATLRTATRREAARAVLDGAAPELYDIHAVEASLAGGGADPATDRAPAAPSTPETTVAQRVEATDSPADGTWDPVPVPPPTYTLKAKAYRPAPTSSATLPADGTEMALEEEFEDLPRVDRVG